MQIVRSSSKSIPLATAPLVRSFDLPSLLSREVLSTDYSASQSELSLLWMVFCFFENSHQITLLLPYLFSTRNSRFEPNFVTGCPRRLLDLRPAIQLLVLVLFTVKNNYEVFLNAPSGLSLPLIVMKENYLWENLNSPFCRWLKNSGSRVTGPKSFSASTSTYSTWRGSRSILSEINENLIFSCQRTAFKKPLIPACAG